MQKSCIIILLACCLICCRAVWAAGPEKPLTIVYNRGIAPIKFTTDSGQPSGILNEYWRQLAKKADLELRFVEVDGFTESLEMVKSGKADLHAGIFYTDERSRFLSYSQPILDLKYYIYSSPDLPPFPSLSETKGYLLGVVQGGYTETYIKQVVPKTHLIIFDDFTSLFEAVLAGEIKVFVASDIHLKHYLSVRNLSNPFRHDGSALYEQTYYGATVKANQALMDAIISAQKLYTDEEVQALRNRWLKAQVDDAVTSQLTLTPEEIAWLKSHPEITFGSDYRWPPFDFADHYGGHTGLSADYINLIALRTGLKIHVRIGVWADILTQMQNGELDGLACAVKTDEREAYLHFTKPYLTVPTVIIVQDDTPSTDNITDLYGKTVSINKNSYMHDWLATLHPQIRLHLSTSNEASLEAVSYGEADAYIGNLAVANYIIRERLLTNLKIVKRLDEMMTEIAVAIDSRQPILLSIIQKALDSITDRERQEIQSRWYMASTEEKVVLTTDEQRWLRDHPLIRITGPPDWAPISYLDRDGEYVGIVTEYLKMMAEKSSLKFETVAAGSWSEALEMVRTGQADIINAISRSAGSEAIVDSTESYMQAEAVLVTRNDIQFLKGLEHIGRRRLGTVKHHVITDYLQHHHPSLSVQQYDNAAGGLQALSRGNIDVFVIDIPTFEYYSRQLSLANLKISGVTPYVFQISFGVAEENAELISILNKMLGLLTQKKKNDIYNNWVTRQKQLIDYSLIWKIMLAASVFLVLMLYWNRRLAHEVSLRKNAEKQALRASSAKSDFLANMSHEIRTPMNSVLGFAELLDNMIGDAEQKSYLKSIRTGGKALLEIINDILDLSKIEAGKMAMRPEPLSLQALFDEIHDFFKARIAQKNLLFSIQVAEDFPRYITMDSMRLRQVIVNLIGNALKFTESGSICLDCHDVEIDEDKDVVSFTLTVADTGVGIPPEQQQAIFNKFEQQEGQDNARYGGTGLGLSICRSLTELMGGRISVSSSPGKGSHFNVVFANIAMARKNAEREIGEQISISQFRPANVLIADDIHDNRRLVTGHFKGSAISFFEADNGMDALTLLSQIQMDMVLMDLRMPVLNGYETITAMKQDDALQHIPVVAFTASVMGEDMEKVNQYGFDDYLRKPVSRQELLRVASQFLPLSDPAVEFSETALETDDLALPRLSESLEILENELLPRWQAIKDKGDFELIGQFTEKLHSHALQYSSSSIAGFADRLQEYVTSFDIIEVDSMMKQFPVLVSAMKQQLASLGRENERQV